MKNHSRLVLLVAALTGSANAQFALPHSLPSGVAPTAILSGSAAVDLNGDALADYAFIHDTGGVVVFGPDVFQSEFHFDEIYDSVAALPGGALDGSNALLTTDAHGLHRLTFVTGQNGSLALQDELIDGTPEWMGATQLTVRSTADNTLHQVIAVEANGASLARIEFSDGVPQSAVGSDANPPAPVRDIVLMDLLGDQATDIVILTDLGVSAATYSGTTLLFFPFQDASTGHLAALSRAAGGDLIGWARTPHGSTVPELAVMTVSGSVVPPVPMPGRIIQDLRGGRFDSDSSADAMVISTDEFGQDTEIKVLYASSRFTTTAGDALAFMDGAAAQHVAIGDAAGDRDLDLVVLNPVAQVARMIESTALNGAADRPRIQLSGTDLRISHNVHLDGEDDWALTFTLSDTLGAPADATHFEVLIYQGNALLDSGGEPTGLGSTKATAAFRRIVPLAEVQAFAAANVNDHFHVPLYTGGPTETLYEFLVVRYSKVVGTKTTRAWPASVFSLASAGAPAALAYLATTQGLGGTVDVRQIPTDDSETAFEQGTTSGREITCVEPVDDVPDPSEPPPPAGGNNTGEGGNGPPPPAGT